MKASVYSSYDDLPLFLNAEMVAKVLGVSPSSGYELMRVVASSVSFASAFGQGSFTPLLLLPPQKLRNAFAGTPLDFPALKVGSRMVVPKEKFQEWVAAHTGGAQ